MKEKPILFSAPMVRALLEGSKTQTRRSVKFNIAGRIGPLHSQWHIDNPGAVKACPYGQRGDRLWCKETWTQLDQSAASDPVFYRADYSPAELRELFFPRWRSSLHMFRWASRITLEIADVRVERLQDISGSDARAEGIQMPPPTITPAEFDHNCVVAYRYLWESINGPGSWDANPLVWVITFRRVLQ